VEGDSNPRQPENGTRKPLIQNMNGLVCTNIFPVGDERSPTSNTFAIRELVNSANEYGLSIKTVILFSTVSWRQRVELPGKRKVDGLPVFVLPQLMIRNRYIAKAVKVVAPFFGLKGEYDFVVFCDF
jgi:hypothetical protein